MQQTADFEQQIIAFTVPQLLGKDTLYTLYDIEDELERERLKTLMLARAKDLKIEKDFARLIKAFDAADKKLADEYTKQNAIINSDVPLKFDGRGQPLNTIENYLLVIRNDPHFCNIKFNGLSYCPEKVVKGETKRWEDADDSAARNYIESKYNIHNERKLDDALRIVFREREYHPIKQIIEADGWDGVERIPGFLSKWLKCEDTPYCHEVSRLIFSGGINRLYNPGCKFDDVPVLIGTKQGEGKSTFVRWLALKDDFFNEITEIEGQKGIEALEGIWICEIAELLALTKTKDVEAVKGYITKQSDKYRRPFDRRVTEHKRQCVFIGTTNKEQFLTDKTGNRRFYPIKVHQSGYDLFDRQHEIKAEILQCWREAKAKLDAGNMKPYSNRALLADIKLHQQSAVEDDYRDGMILSYIEKKDEVCIVELWKNALKNEFSKPSKKDSNDIALILQSTGEWERSAKTKRVGEFGVQKIWKRTNDLPFDDDLLDQLPFTN